MQFDTPLRVTWTAGSHFTQIAQALAAAQVMEVAVRAPLTVLAEKAADLRKLGQTSRIDLVLDAGELLPGGRNEQAQALCLTIGPATLVLDFTQLLSATVSTPLTSLSPPPPVPASTRLALAVCPDATNLAAALELATAAAQAGWPEVRFLHPELAGITPEPSVTPLTAAAIGQAMACSPAGWPLTGCDLRVHDLFLQRALLGDNAPGYGGCQAGGAMAHVDERGLVYPCAALPVVLGDLRETDLGSIWQSEEAAAVRRRLAQPPQDCAGCASAAACRGGCRGLSYALSGSWDERDLGCGVPAPSCG